VRDEPPVEVPRAWRSQLRGVRWVEPAYEAEVEYAEVSNDGLLRQPRYHGLRRRP
jgi:ATP-dependent DNA ligase